MLCKRHYLLARVLIRSRQVRDWPRPGFTVVELLVLIAIISVLIGLILPAVQKVRNTAARTQCQNHMRQIGLALHGYHDANRRLPPGMSSDKPTEPYPWMAWHARLLPYIEQDNLWRVTAAAYQRDRWFENNPPHVGFSTVIPAFCCPADGRTFKAADVHGLTVALTSYLGNQGRSQAVTNGVLFVDSNVRLDEITDGTSNTLMVGERPPSPDYRFGWWYGGWGLNQDGTADNVLGVRGFSSSGTYGPECAPGPYHYTQGNLSNPCDALHFWSPHSGGANFLFCDGSVRFLTYSADSIMPALATRAGGEAVSPP